MHASGTHLATCHPGSLYPYKLHLKSPCDHVRAVSAGSATKGTACLLRGCSANESTDMSAAPTTPSFSSSSPARSLHSLGYSVSSETPPHLTGKKTEARQTEGCGDL